MAAGDVDNSTNTLLPNINGLDLVEKNKSRVGGNLSQTISLPLSPSSFKSILKCTYRVERDSNGRLMRLRQRGDPDDDDATVDGRRRVRAAHST